MRSICSSVPCAILGALLVAAAAGLSAQGRGQQPPPDPLSVQRGKDLYTENCAVCHGTDARGGRGPDLAHSLVIVGDPTGKALGALVRVGSVANGMPPITLTDEQCRDIATFVLAQQQQQMTRRPADAAAVLSGDAKAGEAFFKGEGKCSNCHDIATSFKTVATRYSPEELQRRILYPRGRGGYPGFGQAVTDPPLTATATLQSGQRVTGTVAMLSDYLVTIHDASGARYTVSRTPDAKVVVADPLQAHIDQMKTITDKQMHDLTAFLAVAK
jgi:cytochrome c oxidase cbb3-type subunit 3